MEARFKPTSLRSIIFIISYIITLEMTDSYSDRYRECVALKETALRFAPYPAPFIRLSRFFGLSLTCLLRRLFSQLSCGRS